MYLLLFPAVALRIFGRILLGCSVWSPYRICECCVCLFVCLLFAANKTITNMHQNVLSSLADGLGPASTMSLVTNHGQAPYRVLAMRESLSTSLRKRSVIFAVTCIVSLRLPRVHLSLFCDIPALRCSSSEAIAMYGAGWKVESEPFSRRRQPACCILGSGLVHHLRRRGRGRDTC